MRWGIVALWAVSSVLTAPGAARSAERDSVTVGLSQFPADLHPAYERTLAKRYVIGAARRPLTAYDADWRLVCLACAELPSIERGTARLEPRGDGSVGMAVTYTLLPGLSWGDGVPVTTKDVLFTWRLSQAPAAGIAHQDVFGGVEAVEAVDERTFTVRLERPRPDYARFPIEILPAHVEEPNAADPAQYRQRSAYVTDPANPGLWFGPYLVGQLDKGSLAVLVRNPHWPGRAPRFGTLALKAVENTQSLAASFMSGQVDMISGEVGLPFEQAEEMSRRPGAFDVVFRPGLMYEHVQLNLDLPAFADARVRRALLMAVDRATLSAAMFGGKQPVAHAAVSPSEGYYAEVQPERYDPAAAAALLDAAGWRVGPEGWRVGPGGDRLAFELLTTAGNRSRELTQQFLQDQWRRVGADVRLRAETPRAFFSTLKERKFQAALFAWTGSPGTPPRSTLHSTQVPAPENGWTGQNAGAYRSPAMDAVLDAIAAETDPARLAGLWADMQRLYAAELPELPLFFRTEAHVVPRWLSGLRPTGHQDVTTLWAEDWR